MGSGNYAAVNGLNLYFEVHGGGDTIGTSFGRILPELARYRQHATVRMRGCGTPWLMHRWKTCRRHCRMNT